MFLLRVAGFVVVLVVAGCVVIYLLTGRREYLWIGGRVAGWAVVFALLVFALMFAERILAA